MVGCPSRIRTSLHGFKVRCPTTRRRGSGGRGRLGADEEWSGRRDSNPRPSPWQGDALPTEPLPPGCHDHRIAGCRWCREPGSNWRHRDFQSRALPTELSRPDDRPRLVARRRGGGYHGPSEPFNEARWAARAAAGRSRRGPPSQSAVATPRAAAVCSTGDRYPSRSRGRLPYVPRAIIRRRSGPGDRPVALANAAREPHPRSDGRGARQRDPDTGRRSPLNDHMRHIWQRLSRVGDADRSAGTQALAPDRAAPPVSRGRTRWRSRPGRGAPHRSAGGGG